MILRRHASVSATSRQVREKGWLLDGYPRTAVQAAEMEKNFLVPTKCILLDVPDEVT